MSERYREMKKYEQPILEISLLSLDDVLSSSGIIIEDENVFNGDGENV